MVSLSHKRPVYQSKKVSSKKDVPGSTVSKNKPLPSVNHNPVHLVQVEHQKRDITHPPIGGVKYIPFCDTSFYRSFLEGTETSEEFIQLKNLLLKLPVGKRKELKDSLALSLKSKENEVDRDFELWKDSLTLELEKIIGTGQVQILKGTSTYLAVRKSLPDVLSFLVQAKISHSNTYEKAKCFNIIAFILVSYAKSIASRHHLSLTPQLVAKQSGSLPSIFDSAFPGYVAAGVAHLIFKK